MSAAASTSAWIWDATHRLYYNPATRVWAQVQNDGSWRYSEADTNEGQRATGRQQTSYADIDETLPAEQVWPTDADETVPDQDRFSAVPLLRLVVKPRSPVLPKGHIALCDPSEPLTIGRDKSFDRRIRLKELPVSKTHTTICWIEDGEYWAVVDNGSTHGTFLTSHGHGERRLSAAKTASGPARLAHLDRLTIGNTTFAVHIHASLACADCSLAADSSNLISQSSTTQEDSTATNGDKFVVKTKAEKEQERRSAMQGLKDRYLKPTKSEPATKSKFKVQGDSLTQPTEDESMPPPLKPKPKFIDRAAARRSRDPHTAHVAAPLTNGTSLASVPSIVAPPRPPPVNPFGTESRGAQLLSKLSGGQASTSDNHLGDSERGLGTLIEPKTVGAGGRDARPGLGSKPMVAIMADATGDVSGGKRDPDDWREDVRERNRKRFREM